MTELNKKNHLLLLQISKYLARTRHLLTFCMPNLTVVIMRFLNRFIDILNYYDLYKTVDGVKGALEWSMSQGLTGYLSS